MSEPSVRETAARALAESGAIGCGCCAWADDADLDAENPRAMTLAKTALAAVADHDGLADMLRGHATRQERVVYNGPDPCGDNPWRITCLCGEAWTGIWLAPLVRSWVAHLADVVRAWLRDQT